MPVSVLSLELDVDARVRSVFLVNNPEKLAAVDCAIFSYQSRP